jgi:hypothetical protein
MGSRLSTARFTEQPKEKKDKITIRKRYHEQIFTFSFFDLAAPLSCSQIPISRSLFPERFLLRMKLGNQSHCKHLHCHGVHAESIISGKVKQLSLTHKHIELITTLICRKLPVISN